MQTLTEAQMTRLVESVLRAAGLSQAEAAACAAASVFADLRGAATHGLVYIVPRTLESIAAGKTVSGARPTLRKETGAAALMKAAGVPGPVAGREAMLLAVRKAKEQGIGAVNMFNGNPIGLLGYYANLAASEKMIGIVMANTAPAAAPHGATSAVLGTNPFAYAAPSRDSHPVLFDAATTVASAGKLMQVRRQGVPVPAGWLTDAAGNPVTDAAHAKGAVMLPCGGHKGSALAILIHLLTGGLSGTSVGGEETHDNPDPARRGQGALFLAIDPELFGGSAVFETMVERQIGFIHAARPLPGKDHALYPGERGWAELDARRQRGIPVPDEDWKLVVEAVAAAKLPADLVASASAPA